MYGKFWLVVLLTVLATTVAAQSKVTGVVVEEKENGELTPLPGVNVYWLSTTIGTTTGPDGSFSIEPTSESKKLVFSYIGYKPDTILISNPRKVTVVLKDSRTLDQFEVVHRQKSTTISYMDPLKTEEITEKELFKAACCNLSESFETNPSVDVSYTDAITGTKQIQMLGLTGSYVQVSKELMPFARGLSANSGLTYIPGSWISSIQVSKGTGSVVNGYESIAGQINTELKSRKDEEKLFLNGYINQSGRSEINAHIGTEVNDRTTSNLLLHGSARPLLTDMNNDGFADNPGGWQLNALNRWQHHSPKGWEGQAGIHVLTDNREGGQRIDGFDYTDPEWLFSQNINRFEAWTKTGYVFPNHKYKSIGLQLSASYTDVDASFGMVQFKGKEETGFANLIYQSIIKDTRHKFKTGASFLYDNISERVDNSVFTRSEIVPGTFFEYTYTNLEVFTAVAGLRADYHSIYGPMLTPRLHLRYALNENTVLRASGGKGYRTPALIAENLQYLAGNRQLILNINGSDPSLPYGFAKQEEAWTFGGSLTKNFRLDYRDGIFSADLFHSLFENQLVIDMETPGEVNFYNLEGRSYATSFQMQLDYELIKKLDMRIAYRFYDVKTSYRGNLLQKPLTSQHRAFANLGYETKKKWKFDFTIQWHGEQRIPNTGTNPEQYRLPSIAPDFFTMNAQISKELGKRWEVYGGMENISDYRLENPIVAADNTGSRYFDSSMVWGPVFGRMTYAGFRYKIKQKK